MWKLMAVFRRKIPGQAWETVEDTDSGGGGSSTLSLTAADDLYERRPVKVASGDRLAGAASAADRSNIGFALSDAAEGEPVVVQYAGEISTFLAPNGGGLVGAGNLLEATQQATVVDGVVVQLPCLEVASTPEKGMALLLTDVTGEARATLISVFSNGIYQATESGASSGDFIFRAEPGLDGESLQFTVNVGDSISDIQDALDGQGISGVASGTDWSDFTITFTAPFILSLDSNESDGDPPVVTTLEDPAAIVWEATVPGAAGNAVTLTFVDPGPNHETTDYSEVGMDATVTVATDGGGSIISTVGNIQSAVDGASTLMRSVNVTGEAVPSIPPEDSFADGADASREEIDVLITIPPRYND